MFHSGRTGKRLRAVLGLAGALMLALTGCSLPTGDSGGSSSGAGDTGVTIGLLAPITGAAAADGKLMEQGARLAIDELNQSGGVAGRSVDLKVADVGDQSADAVSSAVSQLTADSSVVGVITGYASTTNFEIDLLAAANMPYILGGGSDQTAAIIAQDPAKYPGIWSITPSYAGYGTDLPRQVEQWDADGTNKLRNKNVYIISSDNPYSNGVAQGLQKTFTEKGWTVTGPDTVPFGEVDDWTTQITKIHQADPSVVVNTDYQTANAARFLTQFSQNPVDALVFSQYAPSVPEFVTLAGPAANGVLYNLPIAPLTATPEGKKAVDAFNAAYGTDPGLYGILTYEEVKLWADAALKVGDPTAREKVGAAIGQLDVETSVGRVHFDQITHLTVSGDGGIEMIYFQIQNDKRVPIAPTAVAEGKLQQPAWVQ